MHRVNVPNQGLVVVGDGEKALFLRNKGSAQDLKLEVEDILAQDNPGDA